MTTIAGTGSGQYKPVWNKLKNLLDFSRRRLTGVDGVGGAATFSHPSGVAIFKDKILYIADTNDYSIRFMNLTTGERIFSLYLHDFV